MKPERPLTVARLFGVLVALVFLDAWISLGVQVRLLVGPAGLAPATSFLKAVREQGGSFWDAPTLFWWLRPTDGALLGGVALGVVLALLVLAGVRVRLAFALSTALYLSYATLGQTFLSFQWDNLLLECGAAAVFLSPDRRQKWGPLLCRLILFKLYFESGIAKWQSPLYDWRDGSAMTYYYETAPLPTSFAWWAHQLPVGWHHFESWATLGLELGGPFALLLPRSTRFRPVRLGAFAALTGFQVANLATANYGFFCYLTLALHVFFLDDHELGREPAEAKVPPSGRREVAIACALLAVWSGISLVEGWGTFVGGARLLAALEPIRERYLPFRLVNTYHLFTQITRERIEPVFETSDGQGWTAHDLHYQPGDPRRPPPWVAPHQPRVDFQLWFYGLGYRGGAPKYVAAIAEKLCIAPESLAPLFAGPLPVKPESVRVSFYQYHFTTADERRTSGAWWKRELVDQTEPIACAR